MRGFNVRDSCLIRENHEHFIPSKYTRYTVRSLYTGSPLSVNRSMRQKLILY